MRYVIAVLLLAIASPVIAQPSPPAQPQVQVNERREKIKKRIRALRAYTLTEELQLDEATAGKLFPVLAKFDDEFDKLLLARGEIQKRLRDAGSIKDPKALDKLIDEAAANQRSLWDTEDKRLAQLRKILTPAQVARTLIVLPAMERKIQNQIRRAVAARHPQPDADDDDDGGELGGNPFAGKASADPHPNAGPTDPFAPAPGAKQQRKQRPQAAPQPPCDPFSSFHQCPAK
ncbi:MAG TPA: hypothetical protein VLB44_23280 [Kofleriaceae bacterium]|nr:hypothetical protein [Kofleriaceae bacterium]